MLDNKYYLEKWGKAFECAENWKKVVRIYKETADCSPEDTAKQIIEELGLEDALITFSTMAHIKQHDGRIYGDNRKAMDNTPYIEEAVRWESGNPMLSAGLDDIHTAHINQIITYLLKDKNLVKAYGMS